MGSSSHHGIQLRSGVFPPGSGMLLLSLLIGMLGLCDLRAADGSRGSGGHDRHTLSLGIYSTQKPSEVAKQFQPFTRAFEAALKSNSGHAIEVQLAVMQTYEDGLRFLREGEVDILEIGAAAFVTAKAELPDLELIAIRCPEDRSLLAGVICVQSNSPLTQIRDLRGKSFGFGDRLSTTGHYLAQELLFRTGIRAKDLRRFAYLGSHENVAAAVAAGKFDAGALNEVAFRAAVKAGAPLKAMVRYRNQGRPWILRGNLTEALKDEVTVSLLSLNGSNCLSVFGEGGTSIQPAVDADFDTLRWAIEDNDRFFK